MSKDMWLDEILPEMIRALSSHEEFSDQELSQLRQLLRQRTFSSDLADLLAKQRHEEVQ